MKTRQTNKRALSHFRFGKVFGWVRRHTSRRRVSIKQIRQLYQNLGLEERACILCNSADLHLLSECDRYGFDLKKKYCDNCGLIQTSPSLSKEFHNQFCTSLYRPLYMNNTLVDYAKFNDEQTAKADRIREYLEEKTVEGSVSNFNIMSYNCSSAGILNHLKPHAKSVQGCDLDVAAIEYAKSNYDFKVEVSELPTSIPKSPNIFILSHVLEHLYDPKEALTTIKKLLSDSDYLYIEVPGLNMLYKGIYKHDLRRYFHIAHVTDYTAGTMKAMAAVSGYDVLHCDENVSALLRPSNKTSIKWEKSEHDSIENIIAIEASR
jgi:hypothetical protein